MLACSGGIHAAEDRQANSSAETRVSAAAIPWDGKIFKRTAIF